MGSALLEGILKAGLVYPEQVYLFDKYKLHQEECVNKYAVNGMQEEIDVVEEADIILICVKPSIVLPVLGLVNGASSNKLFVSIAAGTTLVKMEAALSDSARVIRVMPNTPAVVGQGASAYALGHRATEEDAKSVQELLEEVGVVVRVEESQLDAVTGLSGSGPAYIYTVIEALAEGGVQQGLDPQLALKLAAQTVAGAAAMVQQTGLSPAELRNQVTSPNGTTVAGLAELERLGLAEAMQSAVAAAAARSKELAKQ